ncbi:MAG: thrombospondin type 3 repeat-containing protein, partial [Nitrososphaera sp.]
ITISATAIGVLMLASPLVLSNLLLQPVLASLPTSGARTQAPVDGTLSCGGGANPIDAKLTFTVQGTTIDNTWYNLHNGTFQLTNSSNGQVLYSYSGGNQAGGYISIDNRNTWTIVPGFGLDGGKFLCGDNSITMYVTTTCNGEFETITINRGTGGSIGTFPNAVVQCGDFGDGDTTTAQPSSSSPVTGTTTTTQDRDRDGIPDANDNCPNLPNTRCYKEGDTALLVHNRNR